MCFLRNLYLLLGLQASRNILILSDFLFYWARSKLRGDSEVIIGQQGLAEIPPTPRGLGFKGLGFRV